VRGAADARVLFAAFRSVVATARSISSWLRGGRVAFRDLSSDLARVSPRSCSDRESRRRSVRARLLFGRADRFAIVLLLHGRRDPNLARADSRILRVGLRAFEVRLVLAHASTRASFLMGGAEKSGGSASKPGVVLSVRQRMGHCRMAAAVPKPTSW